MIYRDIKGGYYHIGLEEHIYDAKEIYTAIYKAYIIIYCDGEVTYRNVKRIQQTHSPYKWVYACEVDFMMIGRSNMYIYGDGEVLYGDIRAYTII